LRGSDPGGDQGERRTIPGEKCPLVGVGEPNVRLLLPTRRSRLGSRMFWKLAAVAGALLNLGYRFLISHWSSHPRLRLGSRTDGLPTVCEPRRTLPRIRLSLTRAQQYRAWPHPFGITNGAGDMHARAPRSDESALCTALISSLRGAPRGRTRHDPPGTGATGPSAPTLPAGVDTSNRPLTFL